MFDLTGKVALITGASGGLGGAIARAFGEAGADLALHYRSNEESAKKLSAEIREYGRKAVIFQADLTNHEEAEMLVDDAVKEFGDLHILVNNAGGPPTGTFLDFSLEDWQKAIDLNLFSTITFSREALPFMKEQRWGRIINITSVAVKQPIDGLILSNTARAGVIGLAKTLSNEFGPYNITVNNVCPGRILTDRITHLAGEKAKREGTSVEDALTAMETDVPLRRIGRPEELASLVVFLASEKASYITGTTIQVDGGLTKGLF